MVTATAATPVADDVHAPNPSGSSRVLRLWSWRLFRREWRQQILVVALLCLAVAATVVGGAVSVTAAAPSTTTLILSNPGPALTADLAALEAQFGRTSVAESTSLPVPGSVGKVMLRAESPVATFGTTSLQLLSGAWPVGTGQVAMTPDVAREFGLHLGGAWVAGTQHRILVGLVRNPESYSDSFALVAPGQVGDPSSLSVAVPFTTGHIEFRPGSPLYGSGVAISTTSSGSRASAAIIVLLLSTLSLSFVGLVATAGFAVMAQRRMRALGMLASVGATDRQVRSVMLANGVIAGAVSAAGGLIGGFGAWLILAPHLEHWVGHAIDRWDLPWWTVVGAAALDLLTAVLAAWWPAKRVARIPIVAALSGRPPHVPPARRPAAIGLVALVAGLLILGASHGRQPVLIVIGTLLSLVCLLAVAPLGIRGLERLSGRAPVQARLAFRDLARYESRSAAALRAITLAVVISSTLAISAARQSGLNPAAAANLATNQMMVYASGQGGGGPFAVVQGSQLASANAAVDRMARDLGSSEVLALDQALNLSQPQPAGAGGLKLSVGGLFGGGGSQSAVPSSPSSATGAATSDVYPSASLVQVQSEPHGGIAILEAAPLYVATPAVFAHYGLPAPAQDVQVISSNRQASSYQISFGDNGDTVRTPDIVHASLPTYTSDPTSLITESAAANLGLTVEPVAWLLQTAKPLTSAEIDDARGDAAAAGLVIETHATRQSLVTLGNEMTAGGILLALAVLAMTVGLIRSETARDLRTLTATGASPMTRRTLTALTGTALALLGALVGVAGSYAGQLAWFHSQLSTMGHVPWLDLALLLVGLPLAAFAGGWVFAGHQRSGVGRQPLD